MRNCRACGGVLGRDCFNESDCLQISASYQSNYGDYEIQNLEHYISILIYTMEQKGINVPIMIAAEPPLIFKLIYSCEQEELAYLPF